MILETDATAARYDGKRVEVVDGQAVITQVFFQDKSVDAFKGLELLSRPTYVRVSIQVL